MLFSALGSYFGKDQSSEFLNTTTLGSDVDTEQEIRTDFKEAKFTYQLDYSRPISKKMSLETGAQYVAQKVSNDYSVSDLENNIWVQDDGLTNISNYDQNVLGVYTTGAYENDKWGLKVGLRAENTDLKTLLVETDESNNRNFTNLFPSAHTSFKISKNFSMQAGYSRRIRRPRLWDLNPFWNIRNTYSIRTGNPNLLPEFTDSYEVSTIYIIDKISLNASIYQRNTTDVIESISTFENNVNTYKPLNIGTSNATGIEFNTKYRPHKKVTIQGDFNFNYFNRKGEYEGANFDFSATRWSTKWTTKFKLPAQIDFEINGQYESSYQGVQRLSNDRFSINLGLRKKLLKGKAVINANVRDILASRIFESETNQDSFYIYNKSYRGRFITLGFSYGFGKGEAMEFSGSKRH